jgi:hypothetical protein
MFGVGVPVFSPISRTALTSASSSTGLPASTSRSIEVLKAPSWRVTALRSSPLCEIGQPIFAPIAAASRMIARQKPLTSGSSRMVVTPLQLQPVAHTASANPRSTR